MTGLLVSVCSGDEAQLALAGGADLIDVKDPLRGSLGMANPDVWAEVQAAVAGRVPLSVALGELAAAERIPERALVGFNYAKLGLAGCRGRADWPERWAACLRRWPDGVTPVAVIYADWQTADAPAPEAVLEAAAEVPCGVVLIDTCEKRSGDLFTHLTPDALSSLVQAARRQNVLVVLGGALSLATLPRAVELRPDYIAVRGAACAGARTAELDEGRVRELAAALRNSEPGRSM